jgi:hypothetical protein
MVYGGKETKYIYIPKATIKRLATYIRRKQYAQCPLVAIYYAMYNKTIATTGQEDPRQTTLIFSPMKVDASGNIEPDICGYIAYIKSLKLAKDTENHGELCPRICP